MSQTSQPSTKELALLKRSVVDEVERKVGELVQRGQLDLPRNYSAGNALRAAWLELQDATTAQGKPVLQACTKNSIANALYEMIILGLTPAKDQCYFIAYGKDLVCQRSYFGDMTLAKRVRPDITFQYEAIYEGDTVKMGGPPGMRHVVEHDQEFSNINPDKVIGAYCIIRDGAGNVLRSETLTREQIERAWKQGKAYKASGGTHQVFAEEMAKKVAIARACKALINASDDSYLDLLKDTQDAQMGLAMDEDADGEVIDVEAEAVEEEGGQEPEPEHEPEEEFEFDEDPPPEKAPF